MAEVVPLNGLVYNSNKTDDFSDVVTPPYDVISKDEQVAFHDRHPYNIIRLILGMDEPGDNAQNNRHTRAANLFQSWIDDEILVQDSVPYLYLTSVEFTLAGQSITRYGMIGNVRLEPFEKGIVLPHEKTFSKIKSERLDLMKMCRANLSPIFALYSDGRGILNRLVESVHGVAPDVVLTDNKGLTHRMWRIGSTEMHTFVTKAMQDQKIYIADGHHRYETALNYRNWLAQTQANFNDTHPANYVLMSLSSMEDPGLTILPAHRLIKDLSAEALSGMLQKSARYFDQQHFPVEKPGLDQALAQFTKAQQAQKQTTCIGLFMKKNPDLYLLTLKPGVMADLFERELPAALRDLDVTVLTRLLFMEVLGFDQARLDDAQKIGYCTTAKDAAKAVNAGEYDAAFILNPTKIEQVRQIAGDGLIMPRKSTYFYPKVITGQVINKVSLPTDTP